MLAPYVINKVSRGHKTSTFIYPAVDKGDDVIMSNALENVDLAGKVFKQLLCKFGTKDRLDGDRFFRQLIDRERYWASIVNRRKS